MPERVEVIVKSGSYRIQIFLLFYRSLLACRRAAYFITVSRERTVVNATTRIMKIP